jgi:GT2 family glycosyltransferase
MVGRMPAGSVLVICVNFHCEDDVAALVRSCLRLDGAQRLRVVVVDNNGGSQPHPAIADLAGTQVDVLPPGGNLGYYGAADWALGTLFPRLAAEAGWPEWVIVSNPDIEFPDVRILDRLQELHAPDPPAVLAPAVVDNDTGRDLNPHFLARPDPRRMRFLRWLHRHHKLTVAYHIGSIAKGKLPGRQRPRSGPAVIYAPHGAFAIFNRRYFEAGGSLRHVAFLYGEELFVAETARGLGLKVVYDPRLVVGHRRHATTARLPNRELTRRMAEASSRLVDRYFSSG